MLTVTTSPGLQPAVQPQMLIYPINVQNFETQFAKEENVRKQEHLESRMQIVSHPKRGVSTYIVLFLVWIVSVYLPSIL